MATVARKRAPKGSQKKKPTAFKRPPFRCGDCGKMKGRGHKRGECEYVDVDIGDEGAKSILGNPKEWIYHCSTCKEPKKGHKCGRVLRCLRVPDAGEGLDDSIVQLVEDCNIPENSS
jgi:hypothetical protein